MIDAILSSNSLRLLALAILFVTVVAGVMLLTRFLTERAAVRQRLGDPDAASPLAGVSDGRYLRERERNEGWNRLTAAIESAGIQLTDEKNNVLKSKLTMAGFPTPGAVRIFTLARLVLLFGVPCIYLAFSFLRPERPSLVTIYLVSVVLALLGMYLPNLWLSARAERRRNEIVNGFPDCLDLMLVCVEAGLGLEAAFDRVGREVLTSHPRLAEMLSTATLELRAGSSREQALRNMALRAQVDEIRAFTTLLIQSDKLGTSIGQTLRIYASEMREKRRMRAEEKAHKLPVLLSIPLVACMLPTMIGVLMLPAALRVVRIMLPIMNGPN